MRNFNKILMFITVFLAIIFLSLIASFIWTWNYSKAGTTYVYNTKNNVNNEENLNTEIIVKVEEDKNENTKIESENESKVQTTTSITPTNKQVNKNTSSSEKKQNNSSTNNTTHTYVTASMASTNEYSEEWLNNFNKQIINLQKEFPKGYYWNHMGSTTNSNSVTKTPCNNKLNGNKYCNEYQGKSTIACGFNIGRQCAGFSSMLSDRIFGKNAPAKIFYNYDDLKIGDQARINNNSHTVFIIDKTDEYVIVAECNADYKTCIINWGRKIPRNKLKGFYITRR